MTYSQKGHLEMVLYHALDATGLIEVSLTSDTGPWEELWLTEPRSVQEALTEWTALADAAFPGESFSFSWFDEGEFNVEFVCTTSPFWLRLHPTLADLLAMPATVMESDIGTIGRSYSVPLLAVVAPTALGRSQPRAVEDDELEEFRMGRAAAHHYNRRRELSLEVFLAEDQAEELLASPIVSGHCAFCATMMGADVDPETGDEYDEENLGGRLLIYPVDTPSIESAEGSGGEVVVTIVGTIEGG